MILGATAIAISSQFGAVPATPAWLAKYLQLETAGHFFLYFWLGLFVARYLLSGMNVGALGVLVLTSSISVGFGITDEVHQMFVTDRGAEFNDLLADMAGGLAGALIYLGASMSWRLLEEWKMNTTEKIRLVTAVAAAMVALAVIIVVPVMVYTGSLDVVLNALTGPRTVAKVSGETPIPLTQAAVSERPREQTLAGKDEELVRNVLRDLVHEMKKELYQQVRNEVVKEVSSSLGMPGHPAGGTAVPAVVNKTETPHPEWNVAAAKGTDAAETVTAMAKERVLSALQQKTNGEQPAVVGRYLGYTERKPERVDMVAILAHPSNPVNALTLEQVRKLFSGEYTNWSQVGGPDVPVKVITVHKRTGSLEETIKNHLGVPLSPDAARLPLVSFIIPSVAQTQGAIGFLPIANVEQLDFVAGHSAFRRIAIKSDDQTPAQLPNRMALNTRAYPIMTEQPVSQAR